MEQMEQGISSRGGNVIYIGLYKKILGEEYWALGYTLRDGEGLLEQLL